MAWADDKVWADRFIGEAERCIRSVVGDPIWLFTAASGYQDAKEATDLIVNGKRWGWRLRRPNVTFRDFTLRRSRPTGASELTKILEGWGDFYLYSWSTTSSAARNLFSEWIVCDLAAFREHYQSLQPLASRLDNHDRSSDFDAWSISTLHRFRVVVGNGGSEWEPLLLVNPLTLKQ